jgi:hypothetical protein
MKDNRAILFAEHIGSHQYRLRIRNNNPYNLKQWWIFDYRTKSIRAASNRNYVISIQLGGNNWGANGYAAVTRPYKSQITQKLRWFNGTKKTIRDVGSRCLDVYGGRNTHNMHIHWWKCHNG